MLNIVLQCSHCGWSTSKADHSLQPVTSIMTMASTQDVRGLQCLQFVLTLWSSSSCPSVYYYELNQFPLPRLQTLQVISLQPAASMLQIVAPGQTDQRSLGEWPSHPTHDESLP